MRELECPVCMEYMEPPITFCLGGHNICNNCRPKVSKCPTCKQWFLKTRNVALENLVLQMKYPCRHRKYGCKDVLSYDVIRKHEAKCGYRPETCPVDKLRLKMICTWTGVTNDVKKHLQEAHKEVCMDYNAQHLIVLPNANASSYIYKFIFAYNEIFCHRLLIQRGIMYVVLHYVGPAENHLKYQYKVMIMNKEDTEGVVVTHLARRFTDSEDDVYSATNCVKLHHDLTDRFRNEKGELAVLMKILRVDD